MLPAIDKPRNDVRPDSSMPRDTQFPLSSPSPSPPFIRMAREPMITVAPVPQGLLLHRRDSSSSVSGSTIDTCGYLSGDYGMTPRIHSVPPSIFLLLRPWSEMILLATNEPLSDKPLL